MHSKLCTYTFYVISAFRPNFVNIVIPIARQVLLNVTFIIDSLRTLIDFLIVNEM